MAKNSDTIEPKGVLARMGMSARRWFSTNVKPAEQITQVDTMMYGAGMTTVASLMGTGSKTARSRQQIYQKWSQIEADAIGGAALLMLTTAALGSHESNGDTVFIETAANAQGDRQRERIAEEIAADLGPLLNREAYSLAYLGAAFGDSYARIYTDGRGVVDLYTGEMVRPEIVQPFERGNRTVGFAVSTGERNFERLDVSQMARLKMPRTQWVPQHGVIEKSLRLQITEDDIDNLPLMPSMAGGSLLYPAEDAYDRLTASLLGLVGQRWMDSIDERILQVNLDSMTIEQQGKFVKSVTDMLRRSKELAEQAVSNGSPILERITHIMPVFNDKQLSTPSGLNNQTGRAATISIDDVLLHARLFSGAIGVDLAMLGFADQLQGGLGEGGFFRVSAQIAERSRVIRRALSECLNGIIDIHTARRYGVVFSEAERPWKINFFGSISAMEAEKQRTRADSMNSGVLLAQGIQMIKDMGANEEIMIYWLTSQMQMDEDGAKTMAKIVLAKPPGDDEQGGGGFPP